MEPIPKISIITLSEIAKRHDLVLAGITDLAPLGEAGKRLSDWQNRGFAGEMAFMKRDARHLTDPFPLAPFACSVASFLARYDSREPPPRPAGYGRIARYAWGEDYHRTLRRRLKALVTELEHELGSQILHKIFTDSIPLLERALSERAGGGFVGKNTMIIRPGVGSFTFIAELLWRVEIEGHEAPPKFKGCSTCTRCLTNCPTGALVVPYQLDATKCISYLTIEKRGALTPVEQNAIGEWLFGCDLCQETCPFNAQTQLKAPDIAEFDRECGVGPHLSLTEILLIRTNSRFKSRFKKTSLMRAGRQNLLRNAAAVAANTGVTAVVPLLQDVAESDSSAVVRQSAIAALVKLRGGCENSATPIVRYLEQRAKDPSPLVSEQARSLLDQRIL